MTMYAAQADAWRSSSSCTGSPGGAHEQIPGVGARSGFAAASGPATSFSRSSDFGPTTRNRQGLVRLWFGAQRARSSSSSSTSRSTGSGRKALWVRRVRIASSTSIVRNVVEPAVESGEATPVIDPAAPDRSAEQRQRPGRDQPSGHASPAPVVLGGGGRRQRNGTSLIRGLGRGRGSGSRS